MEHTPIPWMLGTNIQNDGSLALMGANGDRVARVDEPDTDAAFIVRAVNNHEKLLAALEGMLRHGGHDGPCTNENVEEKEACTLHVEASQQRDELARATIEATE